MVVSVVDGCGRRQHGAILVVLLSLIGACHRPAPPASPPPEQPEPAVQVADNNALVPISSSKPTHPVPVRPDTVLDLRIHVALRDEQALDKFLTDVHNPASAQFGRTLTPEEFRRKFFPSPEQMQRVRDALVRKGLAVEPSVRGSVLHARAKAAVAESAFRTSLQHAIGPRGRDIRVLGEPIDIPAELRIESVQGLTSAPIRNTRLIRRPSARQPAYMGPMNATLLRQAYNIPPKALGAGQVIGVIALDGYNPRDIDTYTAANNIRRVPLRDVRVGGYDGRVLSPDGQTEVTMDIELLNAVAPQAAEIRVFAASQTDTAFFDLWNEIANPTTTDKRLVKVISCSWGAPEAALTKIDAQSEATLFKQLAAQGQTVFAASGDNGAKDDGYNIGTDDPASQMYVVGVGGTHVSAPGGVWTSETSWTDGGGGISSFWGVPPWQAGLVNPPSLHSRVMRNVPDVALNADPATGYAIYSSGAWQTVGGTSCAAPIWAGFLSLVHEARLARGLPPLGFFGPLLYNIARTIPGTLHDIADGSSNGYYPAVPGFDLVTGWGTLNGAPMMDALVPPG